MNARLVYTKFVFKNVYTHVIFKFKFNSRAIRAKSTYAQPLWLVARGDVEIKYPPPPPARGVTV